MLDNVKPRVSIILLNYNGYIDTIECLESIQNCTYYNYNIVIVDNASPDASMGRFVKYMQENKIEHVLFATAYDALGDKSSKSRVSLIQSDFNGGYGHGNNIGIKYAIKNGADYVLVLNNDTIVQPGFLEPMVQACEKDKNIGIASGKILFYDQPDVIWFNGGKFSPCTSKIEHFNFNERDLGQVPTEKITFITGCMWLIPRRVIEVIGYINEEYFMYVEDLEFCYRMLNHGYRLKVCHRSTAYHKIGAASGKRQSHNMVYFSVKNKLKFIFSNLTLKCKIYSLLHLLFVGPSRFVRKNRIDLLLPYVRGIIDAALGK